MAKLLTRCGLLLLIAGLTNEAHAQRRRRPPKTPAPKPVPAQSEEAAPAPSTPPSPAKFGGEELSITVADAVRSALTYNPEVVTQALDVEIADSEIDRQRGAFYPVLSANAAQRQESVYPTLGTATEIVKARTSRLETAVGGRTTFGTQYSLNVLTERTGNNMLSRLVPMYQLSIGARVTQPLLRDGGFTPNRGLIERAKLARESTEERMRARKIQIALSVIEAYWNLVVRREQVHIRESNRSLAVNLRELVDRRIRGGQAPRSESVQADATVAEREQLVRQAQLDVINAERQLLAITYLNRSGTFKWENALVPAEKPGTVPAEIDFDRELALALENRPELKRRERDLALAKLDYEIAANARKLRLDVYAEAGVAGVAGTSGVPAGDPTAPPSFLLGGFGNAVGNALAGRAPFFEVGLLLEIPLGNAQREAPVEQAKYRIEQVKAEDVSTLVSLDVRAAVQALEVARSRLQGAIASEKLAAENVEVYRKRYEGGASTIFDTLRVQDELARARAELVAAAAEQEVALARVIAARGTLLEQFGIKD